MTNGGTMDINEEVRLDAACEAYARRMTALRAKREGWEDYLMDIQEGQCYRRAMREAFRGAK